ncbi:short-chain fatty acyl-CoA regulator family protein [Pendulispora albinea]|uniref:Short-chain fatty acyl-CoA regulator family protein n=1 Tax=Pendulispora albinea TaxID=2741071 RepID=A0ABZ2LPP7_9BACT
MENARETGGPRLGAKVRALRRRENLNQVQLAERLGISASYLNLIESNKRPLPASLLIRLAQLFNVDLHSFATDEDARLVADLIEVFADPLFEGNGLTSTEVREVAAASPNAGRAVLSLYRAYQSMRESADSLSSRLTEGEQDLTGVERSSIPSEEVSDLLQTYMNHFPELETGAEELWAKAKLGLDDLYTPLVRYLEKQLGVQVRIARGEAERGTLRRFDADRKILSLSELLPTRSRQFQLAHQIGLLTQKARLDAIASDPRLTTDESRALARIALANYFAGAVLMPYVPFLQAAREERYDIDVIGRRFRVGFEQVCHRLTTLRRPGAEGVPFHMIRIDVAGNISKRFSASGIRFARFSGVCPRWNIFAAFLTPGMIRIQLSRMTDGVAYFCLARTIHKDSGGYHAQHPVQAIGLGCQVPYAKEMVYSDGVDLDHLDTVTPVGVTCRLCDRTDCEQRVLPSIFQPLQVNENVRGLTLYNVSNPLAGHPTAGRLERHVVGR